MLTILNTIDITILNTIDVTIQAHCDSNSYQGLTIIQFIYFFYFENIGLNFLTHVLAHS